ncbi:hypothetical protein DCC85_12155 [Paenibacillus sp. CAA11]|uniref:ABC transporter substrate-binding protein n=1 Tax=Paenibacillus sp. CAA11 TaxID=1532905 RepID=UPI000D3CF3CA|nr:ABC transporter substrate-binding protein [Paenibacillus sp. CAA11]AWB44898.1 hypothetical protein DCC85_12155 [Paenibacillus sp. CAA11]
MRKTRLCTLLVFMLVASLLSACGSKDHKLQVGEVTRSVFYAPQYVAIEKGFFKEEGLEVELQTTFGGDKTMTALLSGNIQVALVGAETSIYVYQQGAEDKVINFAGLTQTDGTFLVARNKGTSFDWSELKGKVFLGQRKGGMPQMSGEYTLSQHGIDPHKDLELIQNIDFANITAAFASGTGEYVQLFEPQASIIEKEGKGHVVASFGAEGGKLPYTAYMAKESYLKGNEEKIQKFTNALYKAQKWVQEHSPEETAEVIAPFFKDTDPAILASSVKRYKEQGTYADSPAISADSWNHLLEIMDHAGELKEKVGPEVLVNSKFSDEAVKQ